MKPHDFTLGEPVVADRARSWANVGRTSTYRGIATSHLWAGSRAVALGTDEPIDRIRLATSMLGTWADEPVEHLDDHHSFAANDGSPVEFSFAMSRSAAEARLLFEPLDTSQRPPWPRQSGRPFLESLATRHAADVSRYRLVASLFTGTPTDGSFSMLCSVALRASGSPLLKVYLNPAIGGLPPHQSVRLAMGRLGLGPQWERVADHLGTDRLGSPQQEVALFALDLTHSHEARVKVYLRHSACGPEQAEWVASLGRDHQPGLFTSIIERLYAGPIDELPKAPMTCLSFRGRQNLPDSVTLYCPLDPNMANDDEARDRVLDLFERFEIASAPFRVLTATICGTARTADSRLSWVSFKRPTDPVVTIYAGLGGSRRVSA